MKVVTPQQMKMIELRSEELGVSRAVLMQNAGKALSGAIDEYCRSKTDMHIAFLAGSGNNGGDCFVAARLLSKLGYQVTVINLCGKPRTALAQEAFLALAGTHVRAVKAYRTQNENSAIEAAELDYMMLSSENESGSKTIAPPEQLKLEKQQRINEVFSVLSEADVIADGVFGTGFHGCLDKEIASFLNADTHAFKIAVDVPSGGNCTSGAAARETFRADLTLAFGAMKKGMTQYPLREYCGNVKVIDIGIPDAAFELPDAAGKYAQLTDRESLKNFPLVRRPDSHKGNFGRVLCITGSDNMRGAAVLSALGALRSGAGLVCAASSDKCIDALAALAPEALFRTLETDGNGFIKYECNLPVIKDEIKKANAILIGCGMGVTQDTADIVRFTVENAECPVIIDADGINCIASDIDILLKKKTDIILTPHPGEMARLLKCSSENVNRNRFAAAEHFAANYNVTVVLKGAGTIIAGAEGISVNPTGNPGMSRGGSGDVLAGITASLAAQGYSPYDSARYAAYIHGLAGDIAAEKLGPEFMLARDIVDALSDSYRKIKAL